MRVECDRELEMLGEIVGPLDKLVEDWVERPEEFKRIKEYLWDRYPFLKGKGK